METNKDKIELSEIEVLKKENQELKKNFEQLMKKFENFEQPTVLQPATSKWDDVTIVHLVDNIPGGTTHIELSNYTIDMAAFGETRTLSVQQFEELVGKYRNWFERGIIAVGAGSESYAKRNNLKMADQYIINNDFVKNMGSLPIAQIEDIYSKVCDGHKEFIISYWKRKMLEGAPGYKDIKKVQSLNAITNGQFEYELAELAKK